MIPELAAIHERDRRIWDACAESYETHIVGGHPDVMAYEAFEEDLLDHLLIHLIRDRRTPVHLFDVCCGSARLHLRYGLKTASLDALEPEDRERVARCRTLQPAVRYEPALAEGLRTIGGIDFSTRMTDLAREKLVRAGLGGWLDERLTLVNGSAFDVQPLPADPVPVAVSVCNSVGVIQGPTGAVELFKSMRRLVEGAGGIALISGYRGEAVASHALGNYESTLNVSGQPRWLRPDTYAGPGTVLIPHAWKRAWDPDPVLRVDVLDEQQSRIAANVRLERDPAAVAETVATGHIRTYRDYESHWYPAAQFREWAETLWPAERSYYIEGRTLDAVRGAPAQLALFDAGNRLPALLGRWGVNRSH